MSVPMTLTLKGGTQGSNFYVDLFNNARTYRTTKFGSITHVGCISRGSPQEGVAEALPDFGVPFYLCVHPLSENYEI